MCTSCVFSVCPYTELLPGEPCGADDHGPCVNEHLCIDGYCSEYRNIIMYSLVTSSVTLTLTNSYTITISSSRASMYVNSKIAISYKKCGPLHHFHQYRNNVRTGSQSDNEHRSLSEAPRTAPNIANGVHMGSPSHGGDATVFVVDISQPSLSTLFILFLCLFLSL